MIEIIVGILVGFAITILARFWASVHQSRTAGLRFHRERFFAAANDLLARDRLEDDKLRRMRTMAQHMGGHKVFRSLMVAVTEVEREIRKGTYELSSPVDHGWASLCYHYVLALSFLSAWGWLVRSMIAAICDPDTADRNIDALNKRVLMPRLKAA